MAIVTTVDWLVSFNGGGYPLLDATIIKTINYDNLMPDHKQYASLLGFKFPPMLNPDQKYSAKSAPTGMKWMSESGMPNLKDKKFSPKKWIYQRKIWDKYEATELFTEWAMKATNIAGAPDGVQAELLLTAENVRDLALSYDIALAEEMTKVQAKWFSITSSEWPGSPAQNDWLSLFNANHTYGVSWTPIYGTYSNLTTSSATSFDPNNTSDIAEGIRVLQDLIDKLKTVKDNNGKFIKMPSQFNLECSRVRSPFWRAVLNNNSKFSGTGNNAMKENQFLFDWNKVELIEVELLGQVDSDGIEIGHNDYVFLKNKEGLEQIEWLKAFRITPLKIKTYVSDETEVITTKGTGYIGVDHYGAEKFISACAFTH